MARVCELTRSWRRDWRTRAASRRSARGWTLTLRGWTLTLGLPTVLWCAVALAPVTAQRSSLDGAARTRATAALPAAAVLDTPWGDPDLQGVWPSGALIDVPFERPRAFGTRAELNDAEFAARRALIARQVQADAIGSVLPEEAETGGTPRHWRERGQPSRLASLMVDPLDGRLPPMTTDGAGRAAAWPDTSNTAAFTQPSDMAIFDRCITRGVLGSMFPNLYSSGTEILQTPGLVVIRHETIHETRIVPLDGRPWLSPSMPSYMGDSRGHWEGRTLVIETQNFNGRTGSLGRNANGNPTSTALRLVERLTRLDAETLQYEVRVDDPQTWTRSWTVAFPLTRDPDYALFEYACHEGNYAMRNILSAARAGERGTTSVTAHTPAPSAGR